ncbi:NAD(P)H-dependent oxidoreductase [Micromonospora lupini]|uniref:NAD(P)H-dependent oxidoreductase n=1 Tax=Micromonospora lupini TaxID=285679 RepID=UPI00224D40BD|nr:NAD(P)H-dependent oxidoreductase [Micromonospora lupini]MCX5064980.1 NAD(P)H-dependent oxidoreductase [Micromonospora lupini]
MTRPAAELPMTALIGNPKPHSRTRTVALATAAALHSRLTHCPTPVAAPTVIDLAELTAELVGQGSRPETLDEVLEAVRRPGLLLVASPTFKAAYSGLLKLFVDVLPRGALTGVVALPLMTAARSGHRHVVDTYLGALLAEVGACVPTAGLCLLEREFDTAEVGIGRWLDRAAPAVVDALAVVPGVPAEPGVSRR